jgi:hypothetical protein
VCYEHRTRKIKCDEDKPFCQKCVKTGRTCDGYESNFRFYINEPISKTCLGRIRSHTGLQPFAGVAAEDIDLLNHYFSTKTLFDVNLACEQEARQLLLASSSDPSIRHAILCLKTLREDLETSGDADTTIAHQTPTHQYGLQQYGMALGGLASSLSSPGTNGLISALLCCQVFISIEQVRKNYAGMAQHIIQGLRILREYRARPYLVAKDKLMQAHHDQLPLLDVFIIKLFAAPCKFADLPAATETKSPVCPMSTRQNETESGNLRVIVPDMRTEIASVAALTLEFLTKVSQVNSVEMALRLLPERQVLLASVDSWLMDLEITPKQIGTPTRELLSVSFLRLFLLLLKIVLLGALDSSPDLDVKVRNESERLQALANVVGERVKNYVTCSWTSKAR